MREDVPVSKPNSDRGSVGKGIGLLALLHLIQLPLLPFALPIVLISLSQLVYLLPAVMILRGRGKSDTVKGLWIGAGITVLINAACFGLLLASLNSASFR